MFTGIIEHIGTIKTVDAQKNLLIFGIDLGPLAPKVKGGDSVAVNGVCLTASSKKSTVVYFDLIKETIKSTSLQFLNKNDRVNLELALKADGRLGGHFVTGHVDERCLMKKIVRQKNWVALTISLSKASRKYIVQKGSVTIEGVSLTAGCVGKNDFDVYLVPYTLKATNLGDKKKGDFVNLETDILAKYLLGK